MGFLIFSCVRTIFLSAIYAVTHCKRVKNLMNTMHTVRTPSSLFDVPQQIPCDMGPLPPRWTD